MDRAFTLDDTTLALVLRGFMCRLMKLTFSTMTSPCRGGPSARAALALFLPGNDRHHIVLLDRIRHGLPVPFSPPPPCYRTSGAREMIFM
jgi:hypothetical protein